MSTRIKSHKEILQKLGIEALNPMQEEALLSIYFRLQEQVKH